MNASDHDNNWDYVKSSPVGAHIFYIDMFYSAIGGDTWACSCEQGSSLSVIMKLGAKELQELIDG